MNYRQSDTSLTRIGARMTDDLRKHPRMPGGNRAAIVHVPSQAPIMCTVADISEGGAGLTFTNIDGLPDLFKLEIKGESQIRACKVAWRAGPHRIGVAFIAEDD